VLTLLVRVCVCVLRCDDFFQVRQKADAAAAAQRNQASLMMGLGLDKGGSGTGGPGAAQQAALVLAASVAAAAAERQAEIDKERTIPIPILMSIGQDRMLHRYDVHGAGIFAGLKIISSTKVESTAVPLALWFDPAPVDAPARTVPKSAGATAAVAAAGNPQSSAESLNGMPSNYVVVANSDYKFKLWQYDSSLIQTMEAPVVAAPEGDAAADGAAAEEAPSGPQQPALPTILPPPLRCVRTALGPTFGSPAAQLSVVVSPPIQIHDPHLDVVSDQSRRATQYLAYSTGSKVVGLLKLPLDGNPHQSMGVIAHPGPISAMAVSADGKFMLTAGGTDRSVNLWQINVGALDAHAAMAPSEFESYASLLDGGKGGEFYEDMVDYFYYAQLRAQGEDTADPRQITGTVNLEQAMALMRALGTC
jgi:hypothetical protein